MAEIRTTAEAMNAGLRTSTTRGAQWQVGQYLDFSQDGVKGYWRIKEIVKYDFNNPADVAKWESTEGWNFERIKQQGGKLLEQVTKPNSKTFLLERVDSLPAGETAIKEPMRYPYGPDGKSYDPSFMKLNQTPAAVAHSAPAAGATSGREGVTPGAPAAAPQATKAPMPPFKINGGPDGSRTFRQEVAYKIENNVYTGSDERLLAALTNPTNDILPYRDKNAPGSADRPNSSFEKGKVNKKYPVVIDGKVFPSSEHAYFYYTKGEYDVQMQEAKMSDVIAAKLQQHPELYAEIEKRGGAQWIETLNHYTGRGGTRDPNVSHWEGSGKESGFIRALAAAFDKVGSLPKISPEDRALVEWAQNKDNWSDFPKADRGGKAIAKARQNYYVSGTKLSEVAPTRRQEVLSNFERMRELATGPTDETSRGARLRRTVGASAPYGSFYDISTESRDIAQIDERLRGQDVKSIVSKLATEFGVQLAPPKNFDKAQYRRLVEEFLVATDKLTEFSAKGQFADVTGTFSKIKGSKFSPAQAEEVAAVMKQISTTLSSYADPGSRIEAAGVRRVGPEGVRGNVSPIMEVVADLARVGVEIDINGIEKADKATADALGRSYGMDSLFNSADSSSNASATRPLVGMAFSGGGPEPVLESKYTNPDQLAVDASGGRFGAKIEYRPNFQGPIGGESKKGAKAAREATESANKAIADTIRYFPGLNPYITAPAGFSPALDREFGGTYELDREYHPDMADAGEASKAKGLTPDPENVKIYDLALAEMDYKGSDKADKAKSTSKIVSLLELTKPQHSEMLDQILRDHTPGRISARRSRIAVTTSQVGPAAALVEANNPMSGELDIAKLVADLRKIEAIPAKERTKELNFKAKSIREALGAVKIFVPNLGPFEKVAGTSVAGSVVPLIRVKPRYKVLPGGAMLSQDGRYIDAFGFPKVEPFAYKAGSFKIVSKTGLDEVGTKPFFPELETGNKFLPVSPFIDQINSQEAVNNPETPSSKPIESPTVQSPNKTGGFEVENYQERMLMEASNKKKYPITEDGARFGYGRDLGRFSRQDLAQEAIKNFLIDQGDLLKSTGSLDVLPILRNRLDLALRNVDPRYAEIRGKSGLVTDDITGSGRDRFGLEGGARRISVDFKQPISSINYPDIHEGTIHPAMKVFLNGLYQLSDVASAHASALGFAGSSSEALPTTGPNKEYKIIISDADVKELSQEGTGKVLSLTKEKITAAFADGIAGAIDSAGARLAGSYGLDYSAPAGTRMPIIPDLSQRAEQIRMEAEQGRAQSFDPGEYGDFGPEDDMGTPVAPKKSGIAGKEDATKLIRGLENLLLDLDEYAYDAGQNDRAAQEPDGSRFVDTYTGHDKAVLTVQRAIDDLRASPTDYTVQKISGYDWKTILEDSSVGKFNSGSDMDLRLAGYGLVPAEERTVLPVDPGTPSPRGAKPDALSTISDEVALMMAGKLAPDEKAALSKVLSGGIRYPKGSAIPDGGILTLIPGMTEEQVAAKVFADAWDKFSKAQLYDIASQLLPGGEIPKLGEPINFNEAPKITLGGEGGAVRYDVMPGVTPGSGIAGDDTPAGLTLKVSENQPNKTYSGARPGTEITLTNSDQIRAISKHLREVYQSADNIRLQASLNEFVSLFNADGKITFRSLVDAIDDMPGARITDLGPAVRAYGLWDQALRGNSSDVRRYLESQLPPEVVPTTGLDTGERIANDNGSEMLSSEDEARTGLFDETGRPSGPVVEGSSSPGVMAYTYDEQAGPRRRADAAMVQRMPSISAPLDFRAAADHASIKASMGASVGDAISGFHKLNQSAFHGPVGFGAGAIADTAYLAAKGWLTPESLAMSVGFNSLNLVNPESLVKLGIPSKVGSKLGLFGAAAGLGLTAATGGDLGRGIAMTAGGLIGAVGGGFFGGFGAIGGSIAGSEAGDYVWREILGNGRKQTAPTQAPDIMRGPRFVDEQ